MPQKDLTQGPVSLSLFQLAAPMMIAVSSSILVSMFEIGFIGQLGTKEVAAITFTFPLTMILSSIALGIGIGTSSVIARSVGAGNNDDVKRLGTHSLILTSVTMGILSLLGWWTIDPVFAALGAPADMLPLIHDYLDIYYPSVVLFTTSMVASSVLRANGNANFPGAVMTIAAVVNLVLDPILIFGWFGMPRMELAGAAAALAITRLFMVFVLLGYLLRHRLLLSARIFHRFANSCWRIMQVGIPAILTQMIGPVSSAIITRMLAQHGEVVVAGFGVATRIEAVAIMFLFALSGSIGPFVGQNYGAKRIDRVRGGLTTSYVFCLIWGAIAALIVWALGLPIAQLVDDNPEVAIAAALYLTIVPWTYGMWGVLMMSSASFNALGKPLPSTALSFTRMFIVYVPLALYLNSQFGYQGIFYASALSNGLMGLLGYLWFKRVYFRDEATPVR